MVYQPKIAIIGGGIAGLATAYHLQKRHLESVVYEKRPEAGGRFSTLERDGIFVNRGALMFCLKLNPCFSELVHELGIEYQPVEMSRFALQLGDRLIGLDQWSIFKSRLFSLSDFWKWSRLKRLLRSLDFDFSRPDERLLQWHGMSLLEFCQKEVGFSRTMINYFVQPFSSFAYVDPEEISADHGLFLLSYSVTPCFSPKRGMGEVARQLQGLLSGKIRLGCRINKVQNDDRKRFMVEVEGGEGEERREKRWEGPYDYCIFATGSRHVRSLMPGIDFEVFAPQTRGVILETTAPKYRPYDLLIFPKEGNAHGVHGGELRHHPDGRSFCGIFLYRPDGELGVVFENYKILERVGWSPAITVMQPGGKIADVTTDKKNLFIVGDFFRYPCHESCVFTAKKVAETIVREAKE
jgi:phytoene dehydrogenase-like protein